VLGEVGLCLARWDCAWPGGIVLGEVGLCWARLDCAWRGRIVLGERQEGEPGRGWEWLVVVVVVVARSSSG
jgi:hypothetical protein